MSDGSLLRFVNLEVVLPDGRRCQEQGLLPDVVVTAQKVHSSRLLLQSTVSYWGRLTSGETRGPDRRPRNELCIYRMTDD